MPPELFNREADNWRPLLAIADVIGGDWPEHMRAIAVRAAAAASEDDPLLSALREIFSTHGPRIHSRRLVALLKDHDIRVSMKELANKLRPFGIKPKKLRVKRKADQGYDAEWFTDTFDRYLAPPVLVVPVVPDGARDR
jgi:putative DNA primase/helicase